MKLFLRNPNEILFIHHLIPGGMDIIPMPLGDHWSPKERGKVFNFSNVSETWRKVVFGSEGCDQLICFEDSSKHKHFKMKVLAMMDILEDRWIVDLTISYCVGVKTPIIEHFKNANENFKNEMKIYHNISSRINKLSK